MNTSPRFLSISFDIRKKYIFFYRIFIRNVSNVSYNTGYTSYLGGKWQFALYGMIPERHFFGLK